MNNEYDVRDLGWLYDRLCLGLFITILIKKMFSSVIY